jgi:integrase
LRELPLRVAEAAGRDDYRAQDESSPLSRLRAAASEDITLASWLAVSPRLTPHGLRHGHKTWVDEDQIADVLKSERLGHEEPGMRGVYGHVSLVMREELKSRLQARWEESLRQHAQLASRSAVSLLDRLLIGVRPTG